MWHLCGAPDTKTYNSNRNSVCVLVESIKILLTRQPFENLSSVQSCAAPYQWAAGSVRTPQNDFICRKAANAADRNSPGAAQVLSELLPGPSALHVPLHRCTYGCSAPRLCRTGGSYALLGHPSPLRGLGLPLKPETARRDETRHCGLRPSDAQQASPRNLSRGGASAPTCTCIYFNLNFSLQLGCCAVLETVARNGRAQRRGFSGTRGQTLQADATPRTRADRRVRQRPRGLSLDPSTKQGGAQVERFRPALDACPALLGARAMQQPLLRRKFAAAPQHAHPLPATRLRSAALR